MKPESERKVSPEKQRIAAWHQILESGELIQVQENVLDLVKKESAGPEWKRDYKRFASQHVIKDNLQIGIRRLFNIPGLTTTTSSYRHALYSVHHKGIAPSDLYTASKKISKIEAELLTFFSFLYGKVYDSFKDNSVTLSSELQDLYGASTDMSSPENITLDNLQTYLDLFRFVTKDARSKEEQVHMLNKLLTERVPYMYVRPGTTTPVALNPRNETTLELLARAPFSFWATVRVDLPEKLHGVPIINSGDAPLVSPEFLYLVTRSAISTKNSNKDTLMRHGGCPILHHDFKNDELMRRYGEVLLAAYTKLTKEDTEKTAA